MYLTYIDESYCKERYLLAALMVPEGVANPLTRDLDGLVMQFGRSHPEVSALAELHGHDLATGKADWLAVKDKLRLRLGLYRSALEAIVAYEVGIVLRAVDGPRLRGRYGPGHRSPHSVVLNHLVERVDERARADRQLAILIADEVDGQDEHRRDLWIYQKAGTWGYRGHKIDHVVDTLHFVPSKNSRLVQAADLIAYIAHRHATNNNPKTQGTVQAMYETILSRATHTGCWYP